MHYRSGVDTAPFAATDIAMVAYGVPERREVEISGELPALTSLQAVSEVRRRESR
jgi:hypothetical protein